MTPRDAERYWNIRPAPVSKVVPILSESLGMVRKSKTIADLTTDFALQRQARDGFGDGGECEQLFQKAAMR